MSETDVAARLADMLVRCGIERGVLGRIDADNVARILLPIVREFGDQRAAEELEAAGGAHPCTRGRLHERAAALRGKATP